MIKSITTEEVALLHLILQAYHAVSETTAYAYMYIILLIYQKHTHTCTVSCAMLISRSMQGMIDRARVSELCISFSKKSSVY